MSNPFISAAQTDKTISGGQIYGLLAIAQAIENLAAVLQQNRTSPFSSGDFIPKTAEGPNGRYEESR